VRPRLWGAQPGAPVRDRVRARIERRNAELQQPAAVPAERDRSDEAQTRVEARAHLGRYRRPDEVERHGSLKWLLSLVHLKLLGVPPARTVSCSLVFAQTVPLSQIGELANGRPAPTERQFLAILATTSTFPGRLDRA
jgi:hypothetical protein